MMLDTDGHDRRLVVGLLGPVRAAHEGVELRIGGPRQQALLAALALHHGRAVSVDALTEAVWDGSPPDAVDRTFKTYVAKLRRALGAADGVDGAEVIRTEPGGYRLDAELVALDSGLFEDEVARAYDHLAGGDFAEAERLLRQALGRWRGDALAGLADQLWARPEAVRLEELRIVARERHTTAVLDGGRVADAVSSAEALVAAHPLRESAVRLLAVALYRAGRHGDALGVTRRYREGLAQESGLDPSPQLVELERMMLEQDPRLDRPAGGRRLRGYVLHEVLASTPLGTVHRAEQPSIGRDVAVTVVPGGTADDPEVVRLFEARMQEVAAVEHQRVVPLYDYWRQPGGAYIVTRLPGGGTLAQLLARGGLEVARAVRLLRQVTVAVAAAHGHGVVHGGLSPDAVVLDQQGDAYLWGFSLLPPAQGPGGDLIDLAALTREVMDRAAVGVASGGHREQVLALAAAAASTTDDRVTSVASFGRSLEGLLDDGGTTVRSPREVGPAAPGPNPYRGLAAFRETDADVFFGRDTLTRSVLARIARQPFVAVFGPSGAGKSSVVRAGVLPRLRSDGHFVTTMVPGSDPLTELGVALSRIAAVDVADVEDALLDSSHGLTGVLGEVLPTPEAEAVLVVDQFEELFTLASEDDRHAFLGVLRDALDHPLRRVRVAVTVRADFLGRVLDDAIAGPMVHERSVLAPPLTAEELHEVVTGPAEVAGVAVEPALATAIVADAVRSEGSLPMVQFALTEVYEAAQDGTMTLDAYRRLGGIEGVLGQRAEEVFAALDEEHQQAARQMFSRLVVPNDDGPPARRRARRRELVAIPDAVIEAFGRARLLRFDHEEETREPTVEVTHEALFRAWPRLIAWIEAGIDDLRLLGHLTTSAEDWQAGGHQQADLYRGVRLEAALAFAAEHDAELTPIERRFLHDAHRRRTETQAQEQKRARRLRQLTTGLAIGLVLAVAAASMAVVAQRREADARQAQEAAAANEAATAAAAQADAVAFAATVAVEQDDLALGALLAAEAYAATPDIESQGALLDVLRVDPRAVLVFATPSAVCSEASGDASRVAFPTITRDGPVIEVRNLDGEVVETMPWRDPTARCVTLPPATDYLIQMTLPGGLEVDDRETGDVLAGRDDLHFTDSPHFFAVHPTDPEVVVLRDDGLVEFTELPSLEPRAVGDVQLVLEDPNRSVVPATVGYSEDGSLAFAAERGALHVLDSSDGRLVGTYDVEPTFPGLSDDLFPFIAAGAGLVGYMGDDELVVTEIEGGAEQRQIDLGAPVTAYGRGPAVEPGGRRVALATDEGIVIVDLELGAVVGEPLPADTTIIDVRWSGPGAVAAFGPNGVVRFEVDRLLTYGSMIHDEALPPGGVYVAADGAGMVIDGPELLFIDVRGGDPLVINDRAIPGTAEPLPDGRWMSVRRDTGDVRIGDADGAITERQLPVAYDAPSLIKIVPVRDRVGVTIASIEGEAAGFVVETDSGDVLQSLDSEPSDPLRGVVPLGEDLVLTWTENGTMTVYDADGQVVDEPRVVAVPIDNVVAGSPDGTRYVTGGFDGTLSVVDRLTGETTQLVGAFAAVASADFVDEARLVSHHADGVTYLWDVDAGRRVGVLASVPATFPATTAVDRATDDLLQPFEQGLARLPLDPDAWLDAVCGRVSRPLSDAELNGVVSGTTVRDPCGAGDAGS